MGRQIVIYGKAFAEKEGRNGKLQHQMGRETLKQALINECQIEFSEDMITYLENGKPVFKELPLFFNISHCPGMAVCALADAPVGADVETRRRIKESVVKKTCNEQERGYISKHDLTQSFLELWTLKESCLKMTGQGIRLPLSDVSFQLRESPGWEQGKWRKPPEIIGSQPGYFYQRKLNKDYILAICTEKLYEEPKIILL